MRMLARVRRETMESNPQNATLHKLFQKADELFDKQSRPGAKKARDLGLVREIVGELLFDPSIGGVPCIRFGRELDNVVGNDSSYTVLSEDFFEVIIDASE